MAKRIKAIKRTEGKPLSWQVRDDLDIILSKCDFIKVHTQPYEYRVLAEKIIQMLDEKYGVVLDYEDQWICNWKPTIKKEIPLIT